jgi:hypothetical protein
MRTAIDPRCATCPLDDCRQNSVRCPVYGARNAARQAATNPEQKRAYNREYQRNRRALARAGKEAS